MKRDRCDHCGAILPAAKTCPECGKVFYRSKGGRTDALYCSQRCGSRARMRRWRERQG